MKNFKILIIIIFVFNSCHDDYIKSNYFDKICINSKGFVVDSSRESWSHYTISNNDYLTLKRISTPSDTFFFRIESSIDTTLQIFEYSFYDGRSLFKIYKFPLRGDRKILFDNKRDTLKNFETIFNPFKKGRDFIAQLESNNILELPNSFNITGYPKDEYATSFLIEYSNKCRYSVFNFDNPYQNSKKFKQAKSLTNFLDYLKQEFNFLK